MPSPKKKTEASHTPMLPPRAEFALRLAHACLLQWEQEAGRDGVLHGLTRVAREACEEALVSKARGGA